MDENVIGAVDDGNETPGTEALDRLTGLQSQHVQTRLAACKHEYDLHPPRPDFLELPAQIATHVDSEGSSQVVEFRLEVE